MMTSDAGHRMKAEEFDLVASVMLFEGGSTREALRGLTKHVEAAWSKELIEYFYFISGGGNNNTQALSGHILSNLVEGFRLMRIGDPVNAIKSFQKSFEQGLGSNLEYWTSLGLFGFGASCLWVQKLDLARNAFLRCIETGWARNDHAAVAKGFGGLGNLFRIAGRPDLAFDAYSTDLGFIQCNHYVSPILRVRRSLAYAMAHGPERGLGILLAETGDFFDKDAGDKGKYRSIADHEVYQGLVACSVVWDDRKTFDLLPSLTKSWDEDTDLLLSIISYHLAGIYHHRNRSIDHQRGARKAFEELEWGDHPVCCWLSSLLSTEALDNGYVSKPQAMVEHDMSLPEINTPTLSFLDRYREVERIDLDPWSGLGEDVPLSDAIGLTLGRGMLSNFR